MSDLYEDLESQPPPDHQRLERALLLALTVVIAYTLLAYLALPAISIEDRSVTGSAGYQPAACIAQRTSL